MAIKDIPDLEPAGPLGLADLFVLTQGTPEAKWATLEALRDLFGVVATIQVVIDGGGSEIAPGIACTLEIPFACTIAVVRMLADQSGSIVVDIWKDSYANYPPTDADSITASAPPTISGATKSQDSTLTGWDTALAAGDILRFNVDSVTDITKVTLCLTVVKTT